MRYALVFATLVLCSARTGYAASVADVYSACSQRAPKCYEYFDGFMEGTLSHSAITKSKSYFCTAQQITPQEAGRLFVKGLDEDAKLKGTAPTAGVAFSIILIKNYPCTAK